MAEPPSLGDFFAKKSKKKIQATNLNTAPVAKTEAKKKEKKDAEEENWEEEVVTTTTMTGVGPAGKLNREEEKKEEEDSSAPAWGSGRKGPKSVASARDAAVDVQKFDKKFPTLGKSMLNSSNINIDDGSEGQVNISTNRNKFADLGGDEEDDPDAGPKRPKEIKPAMVSKKQGEREKDAVNKEVEKYIPAKKGDEDDKDDDEEGEKEVKKEKADKKKKEKQEQKENREEKKEAKKDDEPEDLKIVADPIAAKEKYKSRRRMPLKELPAEELEEEKKETKQVPSKKKKIAKGFDEEEEFGGKKKLQYLED
eukprot:gnl/TRDRNA2_/TRDRNA2_36634_c0_seq1.p1 gnl/TRDRNA2_/TRDRNA2_36634_c0~~gnl/TRDRNA2_/TRDRNA2_36634_c0_seq1.p1  ORF type:complete len:310 (-),score=163.41 gnl/TRDRNA2_/TRDRNA2_36634_c0_seq1:65-994(-)